MYEGKEKASAVRTLASSAKGNKTAQEPILFPLILAENWRNYHEKKYQHIDVSLVYWFYNGLFTTTGPVIRDRVHRWDVVGAVG